MLSLINKRVGIELPSKLLYINQKHISSSIENNFFVRNLKLFEFEKVITEWSKKEGWNPGLYEYLPFYNACQDGHKGLFSNDNRLIASLSAVRYDKEFVFLGMYIVDPNYREQGIGNTLVRTVLEELEDGSLLGINGVTQQVGNYQRKYGFVPYYNNFRFSGVFRDQTCKNLFFRSEKKFKIIGRESLDINQLIDYDASVFSHVREGFLRKWVEMPESYLLAATEKEKICGYGVVSKSLNGYKLAPFFAKNEEVAKNLCVSFLSKFSGEIMQMDIPETNQSAVALAIRLGLFTTFKTERMYKGPERLIKQQDEQINQVYAHTTLELG